MPNAPMNSINKYKLFNKYKDLTNEIMKQLMINNNSTDLKP